MQRMTFVNLPVKDLARAKQFFTGLGYGFDEQLGDENSACLVISDLAFVMLHVQQTFARFTDQEVVDTTKAREVLIGLSAQSREEVDRVVEAATVGGGRAVGNADGQGSMYMRAFLDPDGHQWSAIYMGTSTTPRS